MKQYGWIYVCVALVSFGCESPPDNRKLLDQLVVTTNFDPDADFSTYATYTLATDTIGFITNTNPNDTIMIQSEVDYPQPVLSAIERNLNSRGFTRVDRDADPDLGINVVLINDYSVFQQVVYPGGGYYGGYYGGYGSYYSYPYVNTYENNTGVLVIEVLDLKNPNGQNQVKAIWNSQMGDVYSAFDPVSQSVEAIDQSFVQSPYLEN